VRQFFLRVPLLSASRNCLARDWVEIDLHAEVRCPSLENAEPRSFIRSCVGNFRGFAAPGSIP
jgi:hypothetical protein